jgi:hypothetical protein
MLKAAAKIDPREPSETGPDPQRSQGRGACSNPQLDYRLTDNSTGREISA